jgi:hypothetical protein
MQRRPPDALKRDTGDVRTLGWLFAILGGIPLFLRGARGGGLDVIDRFVAIIDTAVLVGPGVWYIIAASMMRRGNAVMARNCHYAVLAQLAIIALTVIAGFLFHEGIFMMPAMEAIFFVPALLGLLWVIRRIRRTLALMDTGGYAFETLPVAKVVSEVQPIDSLREK